MDFCSSEARGAYSKGPYLKTLASSGGAYSRGDYLKGRLIEEIRYTIEVQKSQAGT